MKQKLTIFLATFIIMMGANLNAGAQHILVKAGLSYTNMNLNDKIGNVIGSFKVDNYTGYHFGLGFQTQSMLGFSLQPEVLYNVKGTKFGKDITWTMNYLEVPVNIQWGPDLVICRPYIQASPYIGYSLRSKLKHSSGTSISTNMENMTKDADRFEYGLGIGAGVDFLKFQISAKYCWNFGNVASPEEYYNNLKDVDKKNARSLEVSFAFKF